MPLIGACAKIPHYQGGGSSAITALRETNVYDELQKQTAGVLKYAAGYNQKFLPDAPLIKEAREVAWQSDVAVICVALPDTCDSEGHDRVNMHLPQAEIDLIEAIAQVQPNIIVVSMNGSAIDMPWLPKVKGLVEAWLSGEAGGAAVADVLTGKINPSGKIAETFPVRIEDTPAFVDYPGLNDEVNYGEGILYWLSLL